MKIFYRLEHKFLKKLLKCTGIATSGYSKVELAARAFPTSEMNLPIIMSSAEQEQSLVEGYNASLVWINRPT